MEYNLTIIQGSKLHLRTLKKIKEIWNNTFGCDNEKTSKIEINKNDYANETLFIMRDKNNKLLAIGSLEDVTINFQKKDYQIKGIGGIVSLQQKKGYGKHLIESMKSHLKKNNFLSIGFCLDENIGFYQKCKFGIKKNLAYQFFNQEKKMSVPEGGGDNNVIYFNDYNNLLNKIEKSRSKVLIPYYW